MELAQQKVHEGSAEDSKNHIANALIPPGFAARNSVPSTLALVPIPPNLGDYINTTAAGADRLWVSDLQNLFSYHHLGFLYSRFLSPKGTQSQSDTKHPLWAQLAEDIEAPPLTALKSTWIPGEEHPMSGLSTIFCDYRQELATNFSNIWTGLLYDIAEKKLPLRETSGKELLSYKQWKDRTEKLEQ
ncbi:MAG: hypothetical protein J3R72DRAFT_522499 [Linnemannia gamsii]|nr:MAG: hypothetical protein J3R72DRAFT_522499 [Linnemannia gamsii]